MNGFFPASDLISKSPLPTLPRCGECGLYKTCISPKMPVSGKGRKKILIVGEAPGRHEDEQGRAFVGDSGKLLESKLDECGISLRKDCWITNALICRPKNNVITKDVFIDHCRPNLVNTVKELQPEIIITLGLRPVQSLIGWLWKESVGPMTRWAGWTIPNQKLNAWICPTWHPSHLLRQQKETNRTDGVLDRSFLKHLKATTELQGRPWAERPDFEGKCSWTLNDDEAEAVISRMASGDTPVAFDFETDRLKPDCEDRRILCCAVSDGESALGYPWYGKAIGATRRLLRSRIGKIIHNAKFEDRWCRKEFDRGIRNVVWDSMMAAHTLDNRRGICGLKFQAFVVLGADSYDDALKPFMQSDNSNSANRLSKEVSLSKLLKYNSIDALLSWKLAEIQMKQMGTSINYR